MTQREIVSYFHLLNCEGLDNEIWSIDYHTSVFDIADYYQCGAPHFILDEGVYLRVYVSDDEIDTKLSIFVRDSDIHWRFDDCFICLLRICD